MTHSVAIADRGVPIEGLVPLDERRPAAGNALRALRFAGVVDAVSEFTVTTHDAVAGFTALTDRDVDVDRDSGVVSIPGITGASRENHQGNHHFLHDPTLGFARHSVNWVSPWR